MQRNTTPQKENLSIHTNVAIPSEDRQSQDH